MDTALENGHGYTSSNPEWDCISRTACTFMKSINPINLPPIMDK